LKSRIQIMYYLSMKHLLCHQKIMSELIFVQRIHRGLVKIYWTIIATSMYLMKETMNLFRIWIKLIKTRISRKNPPFVLENLKSHNNSNNALLKNSQRKIKNKSKLLIKNYFYKLFRRICIENRLAQRWCTLIITKKSHKSMKSKTLFKTLKFHNKRSHHFPKC
jgi:hypothetical protein